MGQFIKSLYHGTNLWASERILKDGFITRYNPKHWLGNGVYFFIDKEMAKWWAETHPTEDFGPGWQKDDVPVVLKATLTIDRDRVLDLRDLSDFKRFAKWHKEFYEEVGKEIDNNQSMSQKECTDLLRCALFDEIFGKKDIDVVVGCFSRLQHLDAEVRETLHKLDMTYAEVQVCVKDEILKNTRFFNMLSPC